MRNTVIVRHISLIYYFYFTLLAFDSFLSLQAMSSPILDNDMLCLVLETAGRMKVAMNAKLLTAWIARRPDESNSFLPFLPDAHHKVLTCTGFLGGRETSMMSYEIEPANIYYEASIAKVCDITQCNWDSDDVELCYINTAYAHSAEALYLPCMEWGIRRRVYFTIALAHAHIVRIPYDVIVVPTCWYCLYNRFFGGEAILQMSDLAEPHVMPEVSTWNVTNDERIIGWQKKPEEEDDDYTSEEGY